jgi:tRNA1Val (adenine37-N6)-methyltransferase
LDNIRIDDLQINNLKLKQNKNLFCFGTDAVLLANFAEPKKGASVLDIGTGNCIIPILMSAKTNATSYTALEIQEESYKLAFENIELNGLGNIITAIKGDVNDTALFKKSSFDYITCNPPYKPLGHGLKNPDSPLAIARHEITLTLDSLCMRASALLKSKGKFAMVHKPERLAEIIYSMKKYKIEPKRICFVHSRANESPCLILIEGAKDGGAGLKYDTPIFIYDDNRNYTAHINELYNKRR